MTSPVLPIDHTARLDQARLALDGLSVGDALGETCFLPENWNAVIEDPRATAQGPWPYTDDTTMALAMFEVLGDLGRIDQNALARRFAARYRAARGEGTGRGLTACSRRFSAAPTGGSRRRRFSPAARSATARQSASPRWRRTLQRTAMRRSPNRRRWARR